MTPLDLWLWWMVALLPDPPPDWRPQPRHEPEVVAARARWEAERAAGV